MNNEPSFASLLVKPGVSKRSDFPLILSKSALLVIDIQDHLSSSEPNSNEKDLYLFSTSLRKAIPNIEQLVDAFRSIRDSNQGKSETLTSNSECEVIFTYLESLTPDKRDISLDYKLSGPLLSTSLPSSIHRATFDQLPPSLHPSSTEGKGDILLPKTSCSVFASTNINYVLKNLRIEQLVVCGQLTDQCVLSAVRDAADLGYFVSVVEDACAATSLSDHERGILGMQGFSRILKTKELLEEMKKYRGKIKDQIRIDCEVDESRNEKLNQSESPAIKSSLLLQKWASKQTWQPTKPPLDSVETLFHLLQHSNVKFIRFSSVDVANTLRTKVIPLTNLIQSREFFNKVAIAKVCMGGLPAYADVILPESGLDAQHVLIIQPDLSSLRILPYTLSTAMVFGTLHQCTTQTSCKKRNERDPNILDSVSEFCTRSLLQSVLHFAKTEFGLGFAVGAEIEFILVRRKSKEIEKDEKDLVDIIEPIDLTVFASTTTLNEEDQFLNDVYEALQKQNINIETLHSESAPGQIEVVIPYQKDAVKLADMITLTRETIKTIAKKHGLCALFLPKVFEDSAGNGMHLHLSPFSIEEPDHNLFPSPQSLASNNYANDEDAPSPAKSLISEMGQSFLEGLLIHLRALTSITMSSPNSYQRVGAGCWTGHTVDWMVEEKECPLRVCLNYSPSSYSFEATNVEYKLIDNSCNVYLSLAAILFSGMDGIAQKMKLRLPMMNGDSNSSESLPLSLEESLDFLSSDSILSTLLGEKLLKSYTAVKKAEGAHEKGRSIAVLVEEACKR